MSKLDKEIVVDTQDAVLRDATQLDRLSKLKAGTHSIRRKPARSARLGKPAQSWEPGWREWCCQDWEGGRGNPTR
jgi:hypothetical protein